MELLRRGVILLAPVIVLAVSYQFLSQPSERPRYIKDLSRGDTNAERSLAADPIKPAEPSRGQYSQLKKSDPGSHDTEHRYDDYSTRLEPVSGADTETRKIGKWRDPLGIDTSQSVSLEVGEFQDPLRSTVSDRSPLTVGEFKDPLQ